MDSRIWEIVFYLMDNLHSPSTEIPSLSDISVDLRNLGYSEDEISSAYSWMLDNVSGSHGVVFTELSTTKAWHRILSPAERTRFTTTAHGYLIAMVNSGDLDSQDLEEILDRVEFLGTLPVDLDQLEAIVHAVETDVPDYPHGEASPGFVN